MMKAAAVIVIFLALSAISLYTVLYHAYASGGYSVLIKDACPSPPSYTSDSQQRYTSLAPLDVLLCQLVAFFDAGLSQQNIAYTTHFIIGFSPGVLAFLVEFSRDSALGTGGALLTGLALQVGSAAFAVPPAWLVIIFHHSSSTPGYGTKTPLPMPMRRVQAQAAVGGVLLGYVLLATLAVGMRDARIIAAWQFFSVYIWAIQNFWLLLGDRYSAANGSASGLPVLRAGFALLALLCGAQHLLVLSQSEHLSLAAFCEWWPSLGVPDKSDVTLHTAVAHLLKWDSIIFYTCMFAASVLLPVGQPIGEALALTLLAPIVSPGAVIALCWMRREERLVQAHHSEDVLHEKKKT